MPNNWNNYYRMTDPEDIPWNKSPDDYLVQLIKTNKLGKGKALDLGCGVGRKSILLAKKGFEVTGVDIAPEAIKQAESNAEQEGVKIKFYAKDATDLSFLNESKFDLILDWANLHGIPTEKQDQYISEIIKHTKPGAKLVLRCFNKKGVSPNEIGFVTPMGPIMIFSGEDIKKLYSKHFQIIEFREIKANHPFRCFGEYLMKRV